MDTVRKDVRKLTWIIHDHNHYVGLERFNVKSEL